MEQVNEKEDYKNVVQIFVLLKKKKKKIKRMQEKKKLIEVDLEFAIYAKKRN